MHTTCFNKTLFTKQMIGWIWSMDYSFLIIDLHIKQIFFIFKKYFTIILNFILYIIILEKPWTLERVINKNQLANDTITLIINLSITRQLPNATNMNFILAMCVCDQSCPDLCDSLDCSPSGSSDYGVFQAISEWVPISSSRRLFLTWGSNPCLLLHWQVNSFTAPPWKPDTYIKLCKRYWYNLHITDNWVQSANIAWDSCITYKNTFIKGYMGSIIT